MSRRRMSMHAEFTSSTDGLAPQGFKPDARRRSSPSTYRRASIGPAEAARQYPLIHPMELPPSPVPSPRIRSKSGTSRGEINSSQIRIDMEAYSGRRHSTKETYVPLMQIYLHEYIKFNTNIFLHQVKTI